MLEQLAEEFPRGYRALAVELLGTFADPNPATVALLQSYFQMALKEFRDKVYATRVLRKMVAIYHDPMGEAETSLNKDWTGNKLCWKARIGKKIRILYEIVGGHPLFLGMGFRDEIYFKVFGKHCVSEK